MYGFLAPLEGFVKGAKQGSDDRVLAERERCAKIAEGNWSPESNAMGAEYILRHRIAADIRSGNA